MLYVFRVDTGSMLTFDMNLVMGSVASLREAISVKTGIAEEKQVLLMNGGEALPPNSRVCTYSAAGTDTSPIFLFNKTAIEQSAAPTPLTDYGPDPDLKDRVESCINMEPTYNTVVARTEMAKQIYEISMDQVRVCEKLVHDQHLQHQGWRAVVANLEDVISAFTVSWNHLQLNFRQFFEQKKCHQQLLEEFNSVLQCLSRIPLMPELADGRTDCTLSDWINQKDHDKDLEQVAEICLQAVSRFDMSLLDDLKQDVESLLSNCNNSDMKEIKGLEERLYGLEKLMAEARKLSAEEGDLSNALWKNQQRLANIRDPSIIPDLCKSHKTQLQVMIKNHQQLRDYRRRCVQAKRELSVNLHQRLRWIMFVEKRLAELDEKVLVHRENIRRLRNHMEIVQQIHLAPQLYILAVQEVARRRTFSKKFLEFATGISSDSSAIFNRETRIRQEFAAILKNHFLSTLFPGIGDNIPSFAVEPPAPFDTSLPVINASHVETLQQSVPELFQQTITIDDAHKDLLDKYLTHDKKDEMPSEATSEFIRLKGHVYVNLDKFKQISETLQNIHRNHDDFRTEFKAVSSSFKSEVSDLTHDVELQMTNWIAMIDSKSRREIEQLELQISNEKLTSDELRKNCDELQQNIGKMEIELSSYRQLKSEFERLEIENESKRRIILEHEIDTVNVKEENDRLESEIRRLNAAVDELNENLTTKESDFRLENVKVADENKLLKNEVDKLKLEIEKMKRNAEKEMKKFQDRMEIEKGHEMKTLRDKLKSEHKLEIENLRIRFRLSSSVERAQDSLTMEPAYDRETLIEQISSLEEKLRDAESKHSEELEAMKKQQLKEIEDVKKTSFDHSIRQLTQEKDNEIHLLKSEITALKSEVKSITGVSPIPLSNPAYNALDSDTKISRLESIIREKDTRIAKLQDSLDAHSEKAAIINCDVGDLVLLCFAKKYNSYVVFSLSPILHFLHSDSVDAISKSAHAIDSPTSSGPGEADNAWCLAVITEKEFCQAKKQQNRYRVDSGTRFYRVKARAWSRAEDSGRRMTSSVSVTSALDRIPEDRSSGNSSAKDAATMSSSCFTFSKLP